MKSSSMPRCIAIPILLTAALALLAMPALAQMTSTGIDCSQINQLRLLQQDNMRAGLALIECGIVEGGQATEGNAAEEAATPPNILVSNRSCTDQFSCTKSESAVWASTKDNGMTVVANYNDHNQGQYSGTSYSKNGGATFTELTTPPFGSGHGTNYGDPIVVYNAKLDKWFGGDLATGCGGQGIGLWTSSDGVSWTTGACAHVGGGDDRESMWVDNEPTSATYGRMYVSWNDFNNNGSLFVTHSDDGVNWSAVQLSNGFIRDVQITGTPKGSPRARSAGRDSTVFVAAMDEGGGGAATRQNVMYRSTDGGVTWSSFVMGARFNPVGDGQCSSNSYFEKVNPIWRHMGWGEPGVGPFGVIHYVYAAAGTNGDHGDIFYQRSTDDGATWSAPVKVNQDADAQFKTQWMPSLSVNLAGKVTISWYDRRSATGACNNATDPGCRYERWGRQSKDNGATFLPEFVISTSLIAQPQQQDSGVQSCYAGDYDYDTALNGTAYITWTDGRRVVNGIHVQDVNFAAVPEP